MTRVASTVLTLRRSTDRIGRVHAPPPPVRPARCRPGAAGRARPAGLVPVRGGPCAGRARRRERRHRAGREPEDAAVALGERPRRPGRRAPRAPRRAVRDHPGRSRSRRRARAGPRRRGHAAARGPGADRRRRGGGAGPAARPVGRDQCTGRPAGHRRRPRRGVRRGRPAARAGRARAGPAPPAVARRAARRGCTAARGPGTRPRRPGPGWAAYVEAESAALRAGDMDTADTARHRRERLAAELPGVAAQDADTEQAGPTVLDGAAHDRRPHRPRVAHRRGRPAAAPGPRAHRSRTGRGARRPACRRRRRRAGRPRPRARALALRTGSQRVLDRLAALPGTTLP